MEAYAMLYDVFTYAVLGAYFGTGITLGYYIMRWYWRISDSIPKGISPIGYAQNISRMKQQWDAHGRGAINDPVLQKYISRGKKLFVAHFAILFFAFIAFALLTIPHQ